jgi:dTDP-4-dehydrorhamnose 3,5-epimerase
MDGESPAGLYIPPGVAHGFAAHTDVALLYLVDAYYGDGADEHGIAWDDTGLGVDWPHLEPVLSERDRANPPLAEALADPPEWVDRPAGRA